MKLALPLLVAALAADTPPAPVFLNHFFIIPEAATFEAMKASAFLREEFAVFEERTTVRNDLTYSGIYFYGTNTYFEFLPPDGPMPAAATGVAFGVEVEGAGVRLVERLQPMLKGPIQNRLVTRRAEADDVPWFKNLGVSSGLDAGPFFTWLMEYDAAFLARFYPQYPPASRAISRANVLERYAARLGKREAPANFWLRDVTRLTLALDESQRAAFFPQLEAYGYAIEAGKDGWIARGPELVFKIEPALAARRGVVAFTLAVRPGAPDKRSMSFGTSTLSFPGDGTATWRFGPGETKGANDR